MTLDELEASLLSESKASEPSSAPQQSTQAPPLSQLAFANNPFGNLPPGVMVLPHGVPGAIPADPNVLLGVNMPPPPPISSTAQTNSSPVKTVEELERELLAPPPPPSKLKTLEEIEKELMQSASLETKKHEDKRPTSPVAQEPSRPLSFAAAVKPPKPAVVNHPEQHNPQQIAHLASPTAFPPLEKGVPIQPVSAAAVILPRPPLVIQASRVIAPIPPMIRPMVPFHPHLMPPHLQRHFLSMQYAPYRSPLLQGQPQGFRFGGPRQPIPVYGRGAPQGRFDDSRSVNSDRLQRSLGEESGDDPPRDSYAGLMTQREREWLINIQRLQLEGSMTDPYVEDYYAMCYNSKKLLEAKSREKKEAPTLLVVDRVTKRPDPSLGGHANGEENKYVPIQFEGSLGKLQVSNLKHPRQLLNVVTRKEVSEANSIAAEDTPLARKELTKLRKLLLDIERLYSLLLKIDHEDKKMAGLPIDRRGESQQKRNEFCDQLFQGITTESQSGTGERGLNMKIASVRKGCALIFRSLQLLQNAKDKAVIIGDLLRPENYRLPLDQKDKSLYGIDYHQILLDSIRKIVVGGGEYGSEALLIITTGLEDIGTIAGTESGQEIIQALMLQALQVATKDLTPSFMSKWNSFAKRIIDSVQTQPELKKYCLESLTQLSTRIH